MNMRILYSVFFSLLLFAFFFIGENSRLCANPFTGGSGRTIAAPPAGAGGFERLVRLQFEYRDKMASAIRGIKSGDSWNAFLMFAGASFIYGLFHAAGPGHRKTIIFSLFLSRKSGWYEPGLAGFLSAGIHAGVSIIVIFVLYFMQKSVVTLSATDNVYAVMEGGTFIFMALFSLVFIAAAIRRMAGGPAAEGTSGERSLYPLIIITSLVPCPGAAMLMVLSIYAGIPGIGVAGVAAMSAGMGIIISLAGYMAFTGRAGLFLRLKRKERTMFFASSLLEVISFMVILLFSLFMAWPFIRSVIY